MSEDFIYSRVLGILGITGLSFIILKAFSFITWSWLWVLSPFWIPILIIILIISMIALVGGYD